MALTDEIAKLLQGQQGQQSNSPNAPVANTAAPASSWVKELIDKRYQPKTERLKRTPVGFDFERDPFDPSSYYRALGTFKDVSRLATNVTRQEVANAEEAQRQRELAASQAAMNGALNGVNPNFTYGSGPGGSNYAPTGSSKKYGLTRVSNNTGAAADYFGGRYGIGTVYGYGDGGGVADSDHPKGLADDFMIKSTAQGTALANDVVKNANKWSVKYVIWNHYIWQGNTGWQPYSGTSNPHTDHVHVSFYR